MKVWNSYLIQASVSWALSMIQSQGNGPPLGECPNWSLSGSTWSDITWILCLLRGHTRLFKRKPYMGVLGMVVILMTNVAVLWLTRIYVLKAQEKVGESDFWAQSHYGQGNSAKLGDSILSAHSVATGRRLSPEHLGEIYSKDVFWRVILFRTPLRKGKEQVRNEDWGKDDLPNCNEALGFTL